MTIFYIRLFQYVFTVAHLNKTLALQFKILSATYIYIHCQHKIIC